MCCGIVGAVVAGAVAGGIAGRSCGCRQECCCPRSRFVEPETTVWRPSKKTCVCDCEPIPGPMKPVKDCCDCDCCRRHCC